MRRPWDMRRWIVNAEHRLIQKLDELNTADTESEAVGEWIELLFDQALLAEGMPLDNPARLASRMTRLMESALSIT